MLYFVKVQVIFFPLQLLFLAQLSPFAVLACLLAYSSGLGPCREPADSACHWRYSVRSSAMVLHVADGEAAGGMGCLWCRKVEASSGGLRGDPHSSVKEAL